LSGFTMVGAYPQGSSFWNSIKGDEREAPEFKDVWSVEKPLRDPVLGAATEGIVGAWAESIPWRANSKL
jgi:uncharacterized protein YjlB